MKKLEKFGLLSLLILLLGACSDKVTNEYYAYEPIYMDYETFRVPAHLSGPQSIDEVGQIYAKDNYLFVVENDKGFHIIDNTDPSIPTTVGFLNLMGCTGIAIRGNRLYANSFIDLVVFDVTALSSPNQVARINDAFPLALPVQDKNYPVDDIDKTKGVVYAWNVREVKEEVDDGNTNWSGCFNCDVLMTTAEVNYDSGSGTVSTSNGTSGSITKITIVNDYLYVMDQQQLSPFNLADPSNPAPADPVYVWGDEVETLFPYEDYIFMGTPSGMNIYSAADPAIPVYTSRLSHARGCDPVVVQNDYAYVTVRSGGACGGTINQLDVIDVSNMNNPMLVNSYDMKDPHGLGIDGDLLMICDGKNGLRIFDASDPATAGADQIKAFSNIQATDVIPMNGVAMLIGTDGIYQYDYTDIDNIELLSKIKF